jgi:hypothetical protein
MTPSDFVAICTFRLLGFGAGCLGWLILSLIWTEVADRLG